jgi:predicted amidohydrolase
MTSKMRLGVVQNEAFRGVEAPRMLQDAVTTIAQAKERGVNLLVFPETYPGPVSADVRYEVLPELQAAAAKHNVWVVAGTTEKAPGSNRAYYIASILISGSGEVQGKYRRTHPRGEVYRGLYAAGPWWEFDYVEADDFPTFDLPWGKLGISICSEVFVPEVARALAERGAELVVFPTGSMIHDLGFLENLQTLVRARAIDKRHVYRHIGEPLQRRAEKAAFVPPGTGRLRNRSKPGTRHDCVARDDYGHDAWPGHPNRGLRLRLHPPHAAGPGVSRGHRGASALHVAAGFRQSQAA